MHETGADGERAERGGQQQPKTGVGQGFGIGHGATMSDHDRSAQPQAARGLSYLINPALRGRNNESSGMQMISISPTNNASIYRHVGLGMLPDG